jgi:two-component system chemotaxis response regulator CheB
VLPSILTRAGLLPASAARNGEPVLHGRAYVAPPDHHMLVLDSRVHLTSGPRENGHRPAVDPLFRSAARSHGRRVIGAVLSGALDDGSAGLRMISEAGGVALVQDPADALYPGMPDAALEHTPGARAVPIAQMAQAICDAVGEPLPGDGAQAAAVAKSETVDQPDRSDDDPRDGALTPITCPECGGSLWEHDEGGLLRFKCHVGHAFSLESLDAGQADGLEAALWAALRSLQERAELFRRLARRVGTDGRLEQKAQITDGHAAVLRSLIASLGTERSAAGNGDVTDQPEPQQR